VGVAIGVIVAGIAYGVAARRVTTKGRAWPVGRSVAFAAALAVALATIPIGDASFTRHMLEHVGLGMVVPVLVALAAPVTLALQGGGPASRAGLRRALRSPGGRVLGHPVVGFAAFGVSLAVLYLTPLLQLSVENVVVHVLVHGHLVLVGCVFLVPVIGVDVLPHPVPFGARLLALIAAVPFHAFLALAIASGDEPLAAAYPSLDDQRSAAAILWTSGELLTLVAGGIVFIRWWASETRAAAREDAGGQDRRWFST
jgi:putative copper resistance protein D